MGRRKTTHKSISQPVIAFLEQQFHRNLTLADISACVGYSSSWVGASFKRETGQSIWSHLTQIRINHAMKLLLQTKLSVTQVAYNVGFNDFSRFSVAFKKKTGTTPRAFRKTASLSGDAPVMIEEDVAPGKGLVRFRDLFAAPNLLPCWKTESGKWRQEGGVLHGKSDESLELIFLDPLPENFAIEFDFRFVSDTHLILSLHGEQQFDACMVAIIGKHDNKISEVILPNANHSWNEQARVLPGQWQHIQVELIDDTIRILLDRQEIFQNKDPFPPAYSLRSRFSVGGWQSSMEIRTFVIHDHGFLPLIPAVRQADSLYNNAMYQRAISAYMRLLGSTVSPSEAMELQYKIGMSFLRQNSPAQAGIWFQKIAPWPQNPFWYHQAQAGMLETDHVSRDYPQFLERAANMFATPSLRNAVRSAIERAETDLAPQGFLQQAMECQLELSKLEAPDSLLHSFSLAHLSTLYYELRQYDIAISCCRQVLAQENAPMSLKDSVRITLCQVLSNSGRIQESEEIAEQLQARPGQNYLAVRCDLTRATNLRAQRRFKEAIEVLTQVPERYPDAPDLGIFALLLASHICSQIQETDQARKMFQTAKERFPGNPNLSGYGAAFAYPPLLVEGENEKAAQVLLEASKQPGNARVIADHLVRAGILFELAGKKDEALAAWKDVELRFPIEHCCFYAKLAQALATSKLDVVKEMPFAEVRRAETFFLVGLLCGKRGEENLSKKYLSLCVAEDPSLNWFTWLAREKLAMQ